MRNSFLHKIWCCLYSISNQIFIHDRRRRKMNNTNLQKNYHEEYEKHNQKLWKQQASWCLQVLFQPACGERVWSVNSRGRDATSVNQFKNCLDKYWQRYGHQKLGLTSLYQRASTSTSIKTQENAIYIPHTRKYKKLYGGVIVFCLLRNKRMTFICGVANQKALAQ